MQYSKEAKAEFWTYSYKIKRGEYLPFSSYGSNWYDPDDPNLDIIYK